MDACPLNEFRLQLLNLFLGPLELPLSCLCFRLFPSCFSLRYKLAHGLFGCDQLCEIPATLPRLF